MFQNIQFIVRYTFKNNNNKFIFCIESMEQIRLAKFNQIVTNFSPNILKDILVYGHRPSNVPEVQQFLVYDRQSRKYSLFINERKLPEITNDIEFLQTSPTVLVLSGQQQTILIQDNVEDYLTDYLIDYEQKCGYPFLSQIQVQKILTDIISCIKKYKQHNLFYNQICLENIVKHKGKWVLTLSGLLFKLGTSQSQYKADGISQNYQISYALGNLLFRLLFGFTPYERRRTKMYEFSMKNHLQYLQTCKQHKNLKIYNFLYRRLCLSRRTLDLLQASLSGVMNLKQFNNHEFFNQEYQDFYNNLKIQNAEIKIMNSMDKKQASTALAAITNKKKNPLEKILARHNCDELSFIQLKKKYEEHYLLKHLIFAPDVGDKKYNSNANKVSIPSYDGLKYFQEEEFSPEQDKPCQKLLRLIQQDRQANCQMYSNSTSNREGEILMYAFPYAMIFQLGKYQQQQPIAIRQKILQMKPYLLFVSALHPVKKSFPKLHAAKLQFHDFQQIKPIYRRLINELYRHFMNEAIRKYNIRNQSLSLEEKKKLKNQGLEYYRLCLKLMEASLIVRKQGRNLDLARIQTSSRKQIESDLNELLKEYFPNKVQL